MADIVIIGAGWAGLSAALRLGRDGHKVTMIERDPFRIDPSYEGAFSWKRVGLPHFYRPHSFLSRASNLLRNRYPDVHAGILDNGAHEVDVARNIPGERASSDDELRAVGARRPLLEWVFRQAVAKELNIRVESETLVRGLVFGNGAEPVVTGVETDRGRFDADLVIDASGRHSPLPEWLSTLGADVRRESTDCQLTYYTRYMRFLGDATMPEGPWPFGPRGDVGYSMFNTFFGDNNTFAIIIAIPAWDNPMKILRHEQAWYEYCRSMKFLQLLFEDGFSEPATDLLPMGNLQNSQTHFFEDGPAALGVIPIGDALCHTNPFHAWGLSLSLMHVEALSSALSLHGSDLASVANEFQALVGRDNAACYRTASEVDNQRSKRWRGEPVSIAPDGDLQLFLGLAGGLAGMHDAEIARRMFRRAMLLDRVDEVERDVDFLQHIAETFKRVTADGLPPPIGPPREELLTRLKAAVG